LDGFNIKLILIEWQVKYFVFPFAFARAGLSSPLIAA